MTKGACYDNINSNHDSGDDVVAESSKLLRRQNKWMHLASILFFVIGSVLYLVMAVIDYQWAHELLELPVWLRTADDDVAWMNYRLQERYNASLLEETARSGGVRKSRARELVQIKEFRMQNAKASKSVDRTAIEVAAFSSGSPYLQRRLVPYSRGRNLQGQTPEELYYDEDWADLPPEIQEAYAIMGYDEEMWDSGGAPETDELDWDELPKEMQEAAVTIGYTEEIWCETLEPTPEQTPAPTAFPTLKPTMKPTPLPTPPPSPPPTRLPTRPPTKMPTRPPTTSPTNKPTQKPTNEPTKEPTSNPTTQPTLNLVLPSSETSIGPTLVERIFKWWDELSPELQYAYGLFGYDQDTWNSGLKLPVDDQLWDEMTSQHQATAYFLGFRKESWDEMIGSHFVHLPPPGAMESDDGVTATTTSSPTTAPTVPSTNRPTMSPTALPSTPLPSSLPSLSLTTLPSSAPTDSPTTSAPSSVTSLAPSMQPSSAKVAVAETSATPEELYYDEYWADLPPEIQAAYSVLGYNETLWNQGVEPESNDLYWDELTPAMQEAALSIGYTEHLWCETLEPTPSPVAASKPTDATIVENASNDTDTIDNPVPETISRPQMPATPTPEELYYDEDWDDLPPEIQSAYSVLGYDKTSWDNSIEPESNDLDWEELTPAMQEAALVIGYTPDMWDAEEFETQSSNTSANATSPYVNGTNNGSVGDVEAGYYDDFDWDELPTEIQVAASTLGYDEVMWNSNGIAWSDDYWWDELSPENQTAASLLGYDKYSWDNVDPLTGATLKSVDDYVSYDDDYVFQVASLEDVWVSKYQILYFFAALSFVFVGCLDLINERRKFHVLMILAGLFGVVSSIYVEEDIHLSNVFNCVSVHFFLLEAGTLFGEHKRSEMTVEAGKWMKLSIMIGDTEFFVGAFIDVVLSYFYLFDSTADWDTVLMSFSILGAVLWLHCSIIYLSGFIYEHHRLKNEVTNITERQEDNLIPDASSANSADEIPVVAVPVYE